MSEQSEETVQSVDLPRQRLQSLDAYRGLIMISLSFVGFGLAKTAENHLDQSPDSAWWQGVHYQLSHTQWVGCSAWDMIQPSFMFMVGVSLAYSYAKRQRLGHSFSRMFGHAIWRSLALILLSIFLMSQWQHQTNWVFTNVLAQIGLGYTFLFLLWRRRTWVQALAAALILVGTWILYTTYPAAGVDIATGAPEVGVEQQWAEQYLQDVAPAWHKNANIGHAIDVWLLNQFPRSEPYKFSAGGYPTLNFLPSIATMLFGLMCGELLRSGLAAWKKLLILFAAGLIGLAVGQALNNAGICPIVKRIWTPSWALFSGGWCCILLGSFYGIIDVIGLRRWSFPLIVTGMNSIAVYCMSMSLKPWTARQLQTHFGEDVFRLKLSIHNTTWMIGAAYEPMVQATMVGIAFWLVALYMYRHRIFIRL